MPLMQHNGNLSVIFSALPRQLYFNFYIVNFDVVFFKIRRRVFFVEFDKVPIVQFVKNQRVDFLFFLAVVNQKISGCQIFQITFFVAPDGQTKPDETRRNAERARDLIVDRSGRDGFFLRARAGKEKSASKNSPNSLELNRIILFS
jgi:hypothetical protein